MRVLVLVISNNSLPVYVDHKAIWRRYMNKHPEVDTFFLEMGVVDDVLGDTLYTRGREGLDGILVKTLHAFRHFNGYDYVIRTNLSSVWSFPRLLGFLQTLPRSGVYCGVINYNVPGLRYVSGAGMILTPDVCRILVDTPPRSKIIDDVDMGAILQHAGVTPTPYPRYDITHPTEWTGRVPDDVFHVRVRFATDRDREPPIAREVVAGFSSPTVRTAQLSWLRRV